jgi:thymidine kinase
MQGDPEAKFLAKNGVGWIEIVCGSMFSGKTEELIRRAKRAGIAGHKVQVFKAAIDDRYDEEDIVSHSYQYFQGIPVVSSANMMELVEKDTDVVVIDEAQFLDEGVVAVCNTLADRGVRVIVAGLDKDFTGTPFGPMPLLLAVAEFVTKLYAVCAKCGSMGVHSFRLKGSKDLVLVGGKGEYEPRCRKCATQQ